MTVIVLLQAAQTDLLEIYSRFGEAAYHTIDADLEVIRQNPKAGPKYYGEFRRKVVPKTPFGVFYKPVGNRVMVSFILDLRQDPEAIERRLSNQS